MIHVEVSDEKVFTQAGGASLTLPEIKRKGDDDA
jgi:hypothetical protein